MDGMYRTTIFVIAVLALASCNRTRTTYAKNEVATTSGGAVMPSGPLVSYADVVSRVAPAVVTIRSSRRVRAPEQFPFSDDPLFRELFGGGVPRQRGGTQTERALGSGVIMRNDGYLLTNHHVVDGAEDIKVDLSSGKTYSAKLIGSDAPAIWPC